MKQATMPSWVAYGRGSWPSQLAPEAMQRLSSVTEDFPSRAPAPSWCLCDPSSLFWQQGCTKHAASLKYGNSYRVASTQPIKHLKLFFAVLYHTTYIC